MNLFRRILVPLQGRSWLLAATGTFLVVLGIASYKLWNRYGDHVSNQQHYRISPDRLQVTEQPEWIRSDVIASALTSGQLRSASLLDPRFVLQVKQAFSLQPWVRRVRRVNKRYPSTVEIDLEWRRPVAMVEVPKGMFPSYDYEGLLPVDEEGYLLPVEQTEEEALSFPKIQGIDTSPAGPPGSPWGDVRVAEAASIVTLLKDLWEPLGLYKIEVPPRQALLESASRPPRYVLITRKRRRFDWGSVPGQEGSQEDSAQEKLSRLKTFLEQFGPLDALELSGQTTLTDRIGFRYGTRRR